MRIDSRGTGGRRRRLRVHCDGDRPIAYRGPEGAGDHAFEVDATDGRTYRLSLSAEAMAAAGAVAPIQRIAALFVQSRGPYSGRSDVDAWPKGRDARGYAGPWPVVGHPPCARWTAYTFFARGGAKQHRTIGDDGGCFAAALRAVRTWGGVLEHPRYSRAWAAFGIQRPARGGGWQRLTCGGWTCEVWQGRYGGRVPKPTWLYFYSPIGNAPAPLDWAVATERSASFSTIHRHERRSRRSGLTLLSSGQRSRTPDRFRDVLIGLARGAVGGEADQGARRANGEIAPARGLGAARIVSWGTGGRRRRLRVHCEGGRARAAYRGHDAAVLEVAATDGRTYRLRFSRDDLGVLMASVTGIEFR